MMPTIGVLHPGEMGSVVAAAARGGGSRVLWSSEGRREVTRKRAAAAGLEEVGSLAQLTGAADVVLSVCPPDAALDVARAVAAQRFRGIYVDANAVSPGTAREIGRVVEAGGAVYVDGGIIGPPPQKPGTTRLYLSGQDSAKIAALFENTPLAAVVLKGQAGAASAVKMAYASYTKGTSALLMAIRALAAAEGVDEALVNEWKISHAELPARCESAVRGSTRKAWRFVGEMEEIAATYAEAGLPDGFYRAAGEVYLRLSSYKDAAEPPSVAEVAAMLTKAQPKG